MSKLYDLIENLRVELQEAGVTAVPPHPGNDAAASAPVDTAHSLTKPAPKRCAPGTVLNNKTGNCESLRGVKR